MTSDLILRSDHGGLARLTLNRPDKLNALTPACFVALRKHIDEIAADASIGCVVLAGAGRSFCAGHDLDAIASGERAPTKHFEPETIDALERLPQPTIARLQGHCLTGGLELALACDFLVAAESTTLGDKVDANRSRYRKVSRSRPGASRDLRRWSEILPLGSDQRTQALLCGGPASRER